MTTISAQPSSTRNVKSPEADHSKKTTISLGPDSTLSCEAVEAVAADPTIFSIRLTEEARVRMASSRAALVEVVERGEPVYGLTTGYGPFVKFAAAADPDRQGAGLIAHLGAGFGEAAPDGPVRATMLARAQSIAQGCSAAGDDVVERWLSVLGLGIVPVIPEIGSVGASGDLVPLSHAARVLCGEGRARLNGVERPASDILDSVGIKTQPLTARDALALVNGTSFMTGYAAIGVARASRLIERAESLTGWAYRTLGARAQALDPRVHAARGQEGQWRSAAVIRAEAERDGEWQDLSRPLQEVYSIRCAPQVLGACRDNTDHARRLIEREINGVNDNPVVCTADATHASAALHAGNFQGQQVAFASDALNQALVQTAVLAERQIDVLLNPELNNDAPLLLAWEPGPDAGLAGAQLTATAIVAEMRHAVTPASVSSIPTNGRNQDVVSMGTLAARTVYRQTERLAAVLGILGIALGRLNDLRSRGRAEGAVTSRPDWFSATEPFTHDRPLLPDIALAASAVLVAA